MKDSERFKLIGSYKPLRVKIGTVLACEFRDCEVVVTGYSEGRIPWPIGKAKGQRTKTWVICGDLADAIRRESNQAVCYWWGITPQTVTKWRAALGVERHNEGTHRLEYERAFEPYMIEARKKAHSKHQDPERNRKISESKKGKAPTKRAIRAARLARIGMKHSDEARAKMSTSHTGKKQSAETIKKRIETRRKNAELRKKKADDT